MGISIRQSIRWPPAPPSEPTSTVVLTSPRRWFVDVRVLADSLGGGGETKAPSSSSTPFLDWAFAGTSSSTGVHAVWRHWVDSRTADAETVRDEGDCTVRDDGSFLEQGTMVDPATGRVAPYEETWRDERLRTSGCAVLQRHDDAAGVRGLVVRLGQYCQGILRTADSVAVERWQWMDGAGWQQTVRLGAGALPCAELVALGDGTLPQEGDSVGGWTVIEADWEVEVD